MTLDLSTMRLTCDQVFAAADAKIPYLIQDYIPTATIGAMIGDWGVGKSPFALQMMLSMVTGIPFLERYTIVGQGLKVLYIDIENNANQFKFVVSRLRTFLNLNDLPNKELTMIGDAYSPRPEGVHANASLEGLVKDSIRQDPPNFIVIDPLRGFNADVETSNDAAAKFIHKWREFIKTYGVSVMFIHHPRKQDPDPTTPRFHLEIDPTGWMSNACGAAAIIQNVDFRIGIEQLPEDKGGILAIRRHIRGYGWYPIEYLDRVLDDDGEPLGYELVANLEDPTLLDHMANLPTEFTTAQLKAVAKIQHNPQAHRLIKKYLSEGVIEQLTRGVYRKR